MPVPKDPEKYEEWRRKQSEAQKKRFTDPEYLKNYSEQRRELLAKPETRKKMSEAQKKRFTDPEQRKMTSERGRKHFSNPENLQAHKERQKKTFARPEVRAKLSEAGKKRFADPAARAEQSEKLKKANASPEVRRERSIQRKAAFQREDVRENHRRGMEGYKERQLEIHSSPEYRSKMSEAIKASDAANDSRRKKIRETMGQMAKTEMWRERARRNANVIWNDPERKEKRMAAMFAGQKYVGTRIELLVQEVLDHNAVPYESQKVIGWYRTDFFVPHLNLIIECDGDYWHNLPGIKVRDQRRDAYLLRKGYKVLRLPESEIKSRDFSRLLECLAQE